MTASLSASSRGGEQLLQQIGRRLPSSGLRVHPRRAAEGALVRTVDRQRAHVRPSARSPSASPARTPRRSPGTAPAAGASGASCTALSVDGDQLRPRFGGAVQPRLLGVGRVEPAARLAVSGIALEHGLEHVDRALRPRPCAAATAAPARVAAPRRSSRRPPASRRPRRSARAGGRDRPSACSSGRSGRSAAITSGFRARARSRACTRSRPAPDRRARARRSARPRARARAALSGVGLTATWRCSTRPARPSSAGCAAACRGARAPRAA